MESLKTVPFERRGTHRYKVKLALELILENGTVLPVESIDLCLRGLQFRCDSWVADEIEPRGIQNHPLDKLRFKVVTDLPGMEKYNSRLYAGCRVIVARRLSQNEYILGIEFIDFENGSDRLLEHFMKQCEQKYKRNSHQAF
ncbi:MAG: hypothetical protein HKP12_13105 [Gammaproteobacteria bacterium]|nr:hypothetical protein [Gammaproteobacteria bacterium]NNJ98085.1 hypothetical protein [Gammaproteobacteria bacterium]